MPDVISGYERVFMGCVFHVVCWCESMCASFGELDFGGETASFICFFGFGCIAKHPSNRVRSLRREREEKEKNRKNTQIAR